jgi:hypothetical protein
MSDFLPITELGLSITGGIFTVLWWLLKQKDEKQESSIKILFEKHDEDARKLDELKLEIARQHYVKPELDAKFDRLELSIKDGMHELGDKFDKLATVLIKRES